MKSKFESYSDYPDSVKNNAKSALDYANENGWGSCGTEVGKLKVSEHYDVVNQLKGIGKVI
jgi:hypothetical protein